MKVATTFPRGFPGRLCRGSLHELRVKLRAPLTGRLCRGSLHELRVKSRAPLTGRPRRGSLHELRVKLRAPLTGRKNQRVGHRHNMKKQKKSRKKSGTSELLGMRPRCAPAIRTGTEYHQGVIGLGMCGHGYHTPQGEGPCGGPTYTKHKAKAKGILPPISLSIQTPPVLTTCTHPETYQTNLLRPN